MTRIKQFVFRYFEAILTLSIFAGVMLMNYLVVQKAAFLNFYYLPALVAGSTLGRRMALLAGFLSIGFVTLFATVLSPASAFGGMAASETAFTILLWGCFLILSSYTVGTLHERNQERTQQLKRAYVGVLEILSKYIEANDRHTLGHSMRVSQVSVEIARAMRLTPAQIENCRVAGLLHDIGKVEISMDLIRRAAGLTAEEKQIIDDSATKGARMIDSLGGVLKDVVPIIEQHHIWYQDRAKGKVPVPVEAFVIALADCYDAIVTDLPHRAGRPPYQALAELKAGEGTQFSPEVLTAFGRIIENLAIMDAVTDLAIPLAG